MRKKMITTMAITAMASVAILTAGCGKGKEETTAPDAAATKLDAVSARPDAEYAESLADAKTEQMTNEEITALVEDALGYEVMKYVTESEGVSFAGMHSVCLKIAPDAEEGTEALLLGCFGQGTSTELAGVPQIDDPVCQKLKGMELGTTYFYMRQGENGAKTKTTEIITARSDGSMYLFLFD